jgi:hypothetical protein
MGVSELSMGHGSASLFLDRPIALGILAAAGLTFVAVMRRMHRAATAARGSAIVEDAAS